MKELSKCRLVESILDLLGVIHLVLTQSFPENELFLPSDTHTHMCVFFKKKYQ